MCRTGRVKRTRTGKVRLGSVRERSEEGRLARREDIFQGGKERMIGQEWVGVFQDMVNLCYHETYRPQSRLAQMGG